MARKLSTGASESLTRIFLEHGSIRYAARVAGVSRNAARRFLRAQGLFSVLDRELGGKEPIKCGLSESQTSLWALDFSVLEKLFELGKDKLENLSFTQHIRRITETLANELKVSTAADQLRLESAVGEYLLYRRFYLKSLSATDALYEGPFLKRHEKLARAVLCWTDASTKALTNFFRLIRELEARNKPNTPSLGCGNLIVQQQQINMSASI